MVLKSPNENPHAVAFSGPANARDLQLDATMAFRSVNLNPPRGPRGGGGGRGGGSGGRFGSGNNSGYNTPPLRIDASGRVDQGFGPVGGAAAAADPDFDIFGIDRALGVSTSTTIYTEYTANIVPLPCVPLVRFLPYLVVLRSMKYLSFNYSNLDLERTISAF